MQRKNHPMQPIVWQDNVIRFKENKLVRMLLDHGSKTGMDLNHLASRTYHNSDYNDDWNQLAQLIGYSVSGFGDLSYANKRIVNRADRIANRMSKEKKENK